MELLNFSKKEPLGFAGSMNFYGYCEGDPVNFVDVNGLKTILASKKFNKGNYQKVMDQVAYEAMKEIICQSIEFKKEDGFRIDKEGDKLIAYTGDDIRTQYENRVDFVLSENSVAVGHTHWHCKNGNDFTGGDKFKNLINYLGTFKGDFRRWNPFNKKNKNHLFKDYKFDLKECTCEDKRRRRKFLNGNSKEVSCYEKLLDNIENCE